MMSEKSDNFSIGHPDDASLEAMLKSTPLREPSKQLDARIDAVMNEYRDAGDYIGHRRFSLFSNAPRRLALAASVLIVLGIGGAVMLKQHRQSEGPTVLAQSAGAHPIQLEEETSTVYDDGVVAAAEDGGAFEQYRRRTVRHIWYEDPGTHAKLQLTIPTEQIVIQKIESF